MFGSVAGPKWIEVHEYRMQGIRFRDISFFLIMILMMVVGALGLLGHPVPRDVLLPGLFVAVAVMAFQAGIQFSELRR